VLAVDAHGPDASAEQIAAAAGVSRTVLYRYFRDKDDLLQAIADEVVDAVVAAVLPHLELDAASTPRRVITSTVGSIIEWSAEHPNLYRVLREQGHRRALGAVEATLADRIAVLLQALMVGFGIQGEDAQPSAYGIVGFVEAGCAWWLVRRDQPGAPSRDRFTSTLCQSIWHLLEGSARANGVVIGYDDPLPVAAPAPVAR
jgi:AcrR family transcriptional regulator